MNKSATITVWVGMRRTRRVAAITVAAALLIGVGMPLIVVVRQEHLNAELIAAIKRSDGDAVIRLLRDGADANARDPRAPSVPRTMLAKFRVLLGRIVHGQQHGETDGVPAIAVLLPPRSFWGGDNAHRTPADNAVILRALLDNGANPSNITSSTDESGTPLLTAAVMGYDDAALLLLDHHADVNAEGILGDAPLGAAAARGDAGLVRLLVEHGAKVDHHGAMGMTPLMVASRSGSPETVRLLLQHGAQPNLRDTRGETALIYAVQVPATARSVVAMLLDAGADASLREIGGMTAADIAKQLPDVARLLTKNSRRRNPRRH